MSFLLVGPRFVPPVAVGSYPFPAAEGRPWKYCGLLNAWPTSSEPTTVPSTSISEPMAWWWNSSADRAQIASG